MTRFIVFYFYWLLLNLVGFVFGSAYGATDNGYIPSLFPGYSGLILGDLVFGTMIGLAQYIGIRKTGIIPISIWWVLSISIGFTVGARTGSILTFRFTENWVVAGIIFGTFMGSSIGFATALTMYKKFTPKLFISWVLTNTAAWIFGESIAFAFLFSHNTVPLVALAIAGTTGIGVIHLRAFYDANPLPQLAFTGKENTNR